MSDAIFTTKDEFLAETNKRVNHLEERVDFLLMITGFTTGFMECSDPKFERLLKEMMLLKGYKDFDKSGDENG